MGISRLIAQCFFYSFCMLISMQIIAQDSIFQKSLPSIIIVDQKRNFIEKDDTIVYNAKAFMNKEVHKVKDLLLNMPGFTVDPSGKVMFNGREIKYVMINGQDLTGNKYETITKNLQAGLISKVELVKRFHENRLLSGFEWGDEQAINLIIDENRKYKINTQASSGISSVHQKKEVDANVLSLYKKTSTLMFMDANNSGRNSNNSVMADPERFRLPNAQTTYEMSTDISEYYWPRSNNKDLKIHQAYKASNHLSLNTQMNTQLQTVLQHRNVHASYQYPGLDAWKYINDQYNYKNVHDNGIELKTKYDNVKNHISTYQLKWEKIVENQHEHQFAQLPMMDTTQKKYAYLSKSLTITGNEYFQLHKKYILECEASYVRGYMIDEMKMLSAKLQFLPNEFAGTKNIYNNAHVMDQRFQLSTRLLFKKEKGNEQVGWKIDNQHIGTTNLISSYTVFDSMIQVQKNALYQTNKFQLFWKREELLNKQLYWSSQTGLGLSNIYWNNKHLSGITGYVSAALQYRKTSFKQTHLGITISRVQADKNAYFASPIMSNQLQLMNSAQDLVFPTKMNIRFLKTYHDLYKGLSFTYNLTYDQQIHSLHSSLYQHPFYSISGYHVGNRKTMIHSLGKFQKNIFPLRIKPFVEMQNYKVGQDQLLNDIPYTIVSTSSVYRSGCVSYWNTKINLETNVELRNTSLNTVSLKNQNHSTDKRGKADVKIKYDISKKLYASMYGMLLWNKLNASSTRFLDAYLEYKMSERVVIMLRVHNLFNEKRYRERINEPYVFQETWADMIPRYVLFSVQINL